MMKKLLVAGLICIFALIMGCGSAGTPTRPNDFVPLTSIQIVAESSTVEASKTIAKKTSAKFKAIGDYSGQFTRDITTQVAWSSNAPSVAEFVPLQAGWVTGGTTPGNAVLTAKVGDVSKTYNLVVSDATISTLTIEPGDLSIPKGLEQQFTAKGRFVNADLSSFDQDITFDATWGSDAPLVISVANSGATKGLTKSEAATGTAKITAEFGGVSDSVTLTATAPVLKSMSLLPLNHKISRLSKVNYIAKGLYSDGSNADISDPVNLKWTSSDATVATIDSVGIAAGLKNGTTTITATMGDVRATTDLTVADFRLDIEPATQTIKVNDVLALKLKLTHLDGSVVDVTTTSEWSVNFVSIAIIGNSAADKGLVTGKAAGNCIISATYGGQEMTTTIIVQ